MADRSSELIPHHEPRLVGREGEWEIWEYRGATVRSCGVHNHLLMPGHPLHEKHHGNKEGLFRVIGHWLDHRALPPPYVWPLRPKS